MDGIRLAVDGRSLWAYMTSASDGSAVVVSIAAPHGRGPFVLVARTRAFAEIVLAKLARRHADDFKRPVWLREYVGYIDHGEV